jgi:hypothetical protein
MLPWSFSEETAAEKYMAQVQHNMWVTHLRSSVLAIITGGGKWVEITIPMDPLYLSVLVSAEKKFWRNTGRRVTDVQRQVKHSTIPWMAATLDAVCNLERRPISSMPSRRARASKPSASSI